MEIEQFCLSSFGDLSSVEEFRATLESPLPGGYYESDFQFVESDEERKTEGSIAYQKKYYKWLVNQASLFPEMYQPLEFRDYNCKTVLKKYAIDNSILGNSVVYCHRKNCENSFCQEQRMLNSLIRVLRVGYQPIAFGTLTWINEPWDMVLKKSYFEDLTEKFREFCKLLGIKVAVKFVEVNLGFVPYCLHPHIHFIIYDDSGELAHKIAICEQVKVIAGKYSKFADSANYGLLKTLAFAWQKAAKLNYTPQCRLRTFSVGEIKKVLAYATKYAAKTQVENLEDDLDEVKEHKVHSLKLALKGFRNFEVIWTCKKSDRVYNHDVLYQADTTRDIYVHKSLLDKEQLLEVQDREFYDYGHFVFLRKAPAYLEYHYINNQVRCITTVLNAEHIMVLNSLYVGGSGVLDLLFSPGREKKHIQAMIRSEISISPPNLKVPVAFWISAEQDRARRKVTPYSQFTFGVYPGDARAIRNDTFDYSIFKVPVTPARTKFVDHNGNVTYDGSLPVTIRTPEQLMYYENVHGLW